MPLLNITDFVFENSTIALARTDFCGSLAFDLWIEHESIAPLMDHLGALQDDHRATRVNEDAVRIHQLEASIPAAGHEITDDVLPAETGQLHRAVSFNKGCYLGQEVVERMRSRGIVARKLCGLFVDGDSLPPKDTALLAPDGKTTVGKVTSACRSIALNRIIALAFVKSAFAVDAATFNLVWTDGSTTAKLTTLPFVATDDRINPA